MYDCGYMLFIESSKPPDILDEVNLLPDHHSSGAIMGTRATSTGIREPPLKLTPSSQVNGDTELMNGIFTRICNLYFTFVQTSKIQVTN